MKHILFKLDGRAGMHKGQAKGELRYVVASSAEQDGPKRVLFEHFGCLTHLGERFRSQRNQEQNAESRERSPTKKT
jgi:hypothetical protein